MKYISGTDRQLADPPHKGTTSRALAHLTAGAQGGYYLASGVWPLLHMPSFELVTGPKRDRWLVKTVGALVSVIGFVQLRAARAGVGGDVRLLSLGSALALASIDVVYWKRGVLSAAYLLDAAAELGLAAGWLLSYAPPLRLGARASRAVPARVSSDPRRRRGRAPS